MVVRASRLSCDWNIEDVTVKYSSNTAEFKELISYIKHKSDWGDCALAIKEK
jgi:hypothetical protein